MPTASLPPSTISTGSTGLSGECPEGLRVEDIIPHRNTMKLVDVIMQADDSIAVVQSEVTDRWPLFQNQQVSSVMAIELVAQAAGILIGWKEKQEKGVSAEGRGWLVGIKNATFYQAVMPVGSMLLTHVRKSLNFDHYTEIQGIVTTGQQYQIADVVLQVLRAEDVEPHNQP